MQVIAAVVGRLSLAYEESAKSSYSDADGERRNKTNVRHDVSVGVAPTATEGTTRITG